MKNIKSTIIIFCLIFAGILISYKVAGWVDHQRQLGLARELRKAISATMLDLSQAKSGSIEGVPSDGQWHHSVRFNTHQYGQISYKLNSLQLIRQDVKSEQVIATHVKEFNMRRTQREPMIVDVKVILKDGILLSSNFRVRLQE